MGRTYSKEKLFHDIDAGNKQNTRYILSQYPELVNEYLDSYQTSLPIMRPIWVNNTTMFDLLVSLKADINKRTSNGYTALFLAAEKGRYEILTKLLNMPNCQYNLTDKNGLSPLDVAIVNGYYNCAQKLIYKGLEPKTVEFYQAHKKSFVDYEIDFNWFLINLEQGNKLSDRRANKHLFVKKV